MQVDRVDKQRVSRGFGSVLSSSDMIIKRDESRGINQLLELLLRDVPLEDEEMVGTYNNRLPIFK